MELKFYLRGLGLGIIITAVILGMTLSRKQTMTDEQVRQRARELGMIENSVLADESEEDVEDVSVEIVESGQEASDTEDIDRIEQIRADADAAGLDSDAEDEENNEDTANNDMEEADSDEADTESDIQDADRDVASSGTEDDRETGVTEDTTSDTAKNKVVVPGGKVSITINSGEGSGTVSRKLAEAGIVSSASGYDDFLCANGYDKRLRAGTFRIPTDASDEQIARIITGQE